MFLAHTFYIDTIVDKEWNKMYYEPKEYENLVLYFSSPIFNSFIMMENFYESKIDVFKVFRIEDDKTTDYFKMCLTMLKKKDNNVIIAKEPSDCNAKTSPPFDTNKKFAEDSSAQDYEDSECKTSSSHESKKKIVENPPS